MNDTTGVRCFKYIRYLDIKFVKDPRFILQRHKIYQKHTKVIS